MAQLVQITGSTVGATALLQGVQSRLDARGTARLMKRISDALERNLHKRFDTKTDPDGVAWQKWAPRTAAKRAKQGRGTLMEQTGRLRDSFQKYSGATEAILATNLPYASYHDSLAPRSTLPRRGLLTGAAGGIGKADMETIEKTIERYFNEQLQLI